MKKAGVVSLVQRHESLVDLLLLLGLDRLQHANSSSGHPVKAMTHVISMAPSPILHQVLPRLRGPRKIGEILQLIQSPT